MYVSAPGGEWEVRLCTLKPSQIDGTIIAHGKFIISKTPSSGTLFRHPLHNLILLSPQDFPIDGIMPPLDTCWRLSRDDSNQWFILPNCTQLCSWFFFLVICMSERMAVVLCNFTSELRYANSQISHLTPQHWLLESIQSRVEHFLLFLRETYVIEDKPNKQTWLNLSSFFFLVLPFSWFQVVCEWAKSSDIRYWDLESFNV